MGLFVVVAGLLVVEVTGCIAAFVVVEGLAVVLTAVVTGFVADVVTAGVSAVSSIAIYPSQYKGSSASLLALWISSADALN